MLNTILTGKFEELASSIPPSSVDLVFTSPPYAMQRAKQYGGVEPATYPTWTVTWMHECKRLLKPTGSVIINIHPHVNDAKCDTYVYRSIIALEDAGWSYLGQAIWQKPNAMPTSAPNRLRNVYESLHWFALDARQAFCNPKATGKWSNLIGATSDKRIGGISARNSGTYRSGFARAPDVFVVPVGEQGPIPNAHPAKMPVALAEQIIQIFCPVGGTVLDPFMGSGTAAVAAIPYGRQFVGTEQMPEYVEIANKRILDKQTNPASDDFFHWKSVPIPSLDEEPAEIGLDLDAFTDPDNEIEPYEGGDMDGGVRIFACKAEAIT